MRLASLPVINARYWLAISAASVFGANLGDLVSHDLHLGHWRGLPVLAALFALALAAERRSRHATEAWYWLAIVLLRTAATNLGDLATHDFHADPVPAMLCLLALLAGFVLAGRRPLADGPTIVRPAGDGWYWAAMLTAGTLGTVAGDCVAGDLGLGAGRATVALAIVQLAALAAGARSRWRGKLAYWAAIVAVRSMGTTLGDWLAFRHGAALGLPVSTTLSGAVMVAVLLSWTVDPEGRPGALPPGAAGSNQWRRPAKDSRP